MEGFHEDVLVGGNEEVAEDHMHGDHTMDYGFFDDNDAAPPPPPSPPPMDGLLSGMQSQEEGYGVGGGGGGGDELAKPYDEGIFTEADGGGPLLPEPSEMCEQGSAFREWRR